MVIIEMSGGLGNQMFQYALYEAFLNRRIDVRIDTSFYTCIEMKGHPEICRFPEVKYKTAELHTVSTIRGYGYNDNLIDKINHHIFQNRKKFFTEDMDAGFQAEIFKMKNVYLNGFWQSECYFSDIDQIIRQKYIFPYDISGKNDNNLNMLLRKMYNSESVSLHVRRGDYLKKELVSIYGNICTLDYYKRAMEYMKSKLEKPVFFLFSDDIKWVKENVFQPGMIIVNEKSEWDGMTDMYLMSNCKHHIIANSSFSWWGAWLGNNLNKMVVAPTKWYNNYAQTDMICKEWIKL